MAWQWSAFRSSKTMAGAVLVGFEMFVLYENLAAAAAWLRHVRSEALGVVRPQSWKSRKRCRPTPPILSAFCKPCCGTCCFHPGRCCSS